MIGIFPYRTEQEIKKLPRQTLIFITACALVHIITGSLQDQQLNNWINLTGYDFRFPPSALSSVFIHGNFEHLFFNMFFFFLFAAPLELVEGKRKFWILIIFTAFFSSYFYTLVLWIFSLWTSSSDPLQIYNKSIGASGVVSAFAMAYLVRFWRKKLYAVITVFGYPIPKRIVISAWVMVLAYWLTGDLVFGVLFQGILPITNINYFLHLGGFLAGLILSFHWQFWRKHQRDYYIEYAEDLALCPLTGAYAAHKTYQQALALDPENPEILRELARTSWQMGQNSESISYYRRAIDGFVKANKERELAEVYGEAFERYRLIFLSEYQLELARVLLKSGKWKPAEQALKFFCAGMELKGLEKKHSSIYIRARLVLAWILDHYVQKFDSAREIVIDLLHDFPEHPLLKYPAERVKRYAKGRELFKFNPDQPEFPFIRLQKQTAQSQVAEKLPWYKVRTRFFIGIPICILLFLLALIVLNWFLIGF